MYLNMLCFPTLRCRQCVNINYSFWVDDVDFKCTLHFVYNFTLKVFGSNYGEIGISSTGNIRIDYQEIYIWLQVRAGTREITFSAAWDIGEFSH